MRTYRAVADKDYYIHPYYRIQHKRHMKVMPYVIKLIEITITFIGLYVIYYEACELIKAVQ